LDPLIIIVVAAFIITAVFVGYHASQEPREKMAESHEMETDSISNQVEQKITTLSINANLSKS